jgi:hypothetical protein
MRKYILCVLCRYPIWDGITGSQFTIKGEFCEDCLKDYTVKVKVKNFQLIEAIELQS